MRARVLSDCAALGCAIGQVADGPDAMLREYVERGVLDPHPEAVTYALSVGGEVVTVGPSGEPPEPAVEKRVRKAVAA